MYFGANSFYVLASVYDLKPKYILIMRQNNDQQHNPNIYFWTALKKWRFKSVLWLDLKQVVCALKPGNMAKLEQICWEE